MREKICVKSKSKSLGLFSQLDMMGGCRHVTDIQTEKDRGNQTTLCHPSLHATMR